MGLVLCFGILLPLFLFRRVVVFILIFGLGVLLRVSRIFGILPLLLLRFEIGSLRVPGECRKLPFTAYRTATGQSDML